MEVGDVINLEVHGTTLTIQGASGVTINGQSGTSFSKGNNQLYAGGIIRKSGNKYCIIMRIQLYILLFFLLCGNPIVAQNYYYSLKTAQETISQNATVISTVEELIAELKTWANLYLKAGNYQLTNTLYLNDLTNVTIKGEDGAVITGNLVTLLQFRGTVNSITFENIAFNSTSSYTSVDKGAGIVYFDGSFEDILFENCEFTCPNVVSNRLKFLSEGASKSKNITIYNCNFHNNMINK